MGTQLIAEYAGEILILDYNLVWPSEYGRKYVLMMTDKMSRLLHHIVSHDTTAVPACRGVIEWSSKYGLPSGSSVMGELTSLRGQWSWSRKRWTSVIILLYVTHCPWANGSIEVVGRALLCSIRVLLSEKKLGLEKWEDVLSLINFGLSHMHHSVLGGRTPLKVMTCRKPKSAVDIMY